MTSGTETLVDTGASIDSANIFNHAETIQTVISSLDTEKTAVVNKTGDTWKFQYGTVEVIVNITGEGNSDIFTVLATVLTYPVKDEAKLMKTLLEKNAAETFEARYAIQGDRVIVIAARSIEDLSPKEIARIISVVAAIADENDEPLKAEFGA
jgi:ribosome biogenesis SPOUT family RNA methylase Rps3